MPSKRIFVSHSANRDVASRPLLDELEARLNAEADVEVLLDHSTLTPGEDWRSGINAWCGMCDGAVLLVTPHSLTAEFCTYEWSILSFRKATSPHFALLVVYAGTTPDDLRNKPQNLGEIQGVDVTNLAASWPRIQQWLTTAIPVEGPSLLQADLIARLLKERLDDPFGPQMTQARRRGSLPLGRWSPLESPWKQFALQLIGLGLKKAMPALLELKDEFAQQPGTWSEIIDLVSSSWVDDRASSRLGNLSLEGNAERSVALNASHGATGRLYIIKASGRRPAAAWCMAWVTDSIANLDGLKASVRQSLCQALKLGPDADLQQRLQVKRNNQQPVVMCLDVASLNSDWLAELRRQFGYVTFFVLAGAQIIELDGVEWLQPELPADFEEAFWSYYHGNQEEFILT